MPTNKEPPSPSTATMTVNVYAEALLPVDDVYGSRVFFDYKQLKDKQGKNLSFRHHAIKILIGNRIRHTDDDDDTAAVTFWYSTDDQRKLLVKIFERALDELSKDEAKY